MATEKKLHEARNAFRHKDWGGAYRNLSDADHEDTLKASDLELLAITAYLLGRSAESNAHWSRAHTEFLSTGEVRGAVRCAFWLGFTLLNTGESARGAGWISRANRLLEEAGLSCAEQGYLLLPLALRSLAGGDGKSALDTFAEATKIAQRFDEIDLKTLTCFGRGLAFIRLGQLEEGVSLLDEAMADVDAHQLSPIVSGIVYCGVIEACLEIYDLRRAQEWTAALSEWCASQPDLIPFRGPCMIRRSEIMQLHGDWAGAIQEVSKANQLISQTKGDPIAGFAYYQLGELCRLRGDYAQAEEAYRQSNSYGRNPQPGLALLSLARGQIELARLSIARALEEAKKPKVRTSILPAYIEIMVAAMEIAKAEGAAHELIVIAKKLNAPLLHATAAHAEGSVLLSQGHARVALEKFHDAMVIWSRLEAPYELARVRVLIGLARLKVGDQETATMEFEAAESTFSQLKARPDLARVGALLHKSGSEKTHGLTSRELEVLRLLATGQTNKMIAAEMTVSERTVHRHVSNIFAKLEVSSRAAATAYAYQHELV